MNPNVFKGFRPLCFIKPDRVLSYRDDIGEFVNESSQLSHLIKAASKLGVLYGFFYIQTFVPLGDDNSIVVDCYLGTEVKQGDGTLRELPTFRTVDQVPSNVAAIMVRGRLASFVSLFKCPDLEFDVFFTSEELAKLTDPIGILRTWLTEDKTELNKLILSSLFKTSKESLKKGKKKDV